MTSLPPFATLMYDSEQIRSLKFATQQKDEVIRLFVRRDGITNAPWIITTVFLAFLPSLLNYLLEQSNTFSVQPLFDSFSPALREIGLLLYYLIVFYFAFVQFLEWYFTVLIATNKRVLDFNFRPPFSLETTQAQISDIQDVSHTQSGIFAVIFNFGNVAIQTAGTRQNIFLSKVPNPNRVHDIIANLLP